MSSTITKIIETIKKKNFKEAEKLCNEYKLNQDLHILYNLKGIIFISLNDPRKAIENFQLSINKKKDYLDAYSNLANVYFSVKNVLNSITTVREALNYYPKNQKLHFNLAFFLSENYQYQKAIEEYHQAIKFGYNKEEALNNIGNIYIDKKNYTKAKEYFLKCLEISSSNYLTINNLIRSLILKKDFVEAEKYQKIADSLEIKNNIYFINKAELLFFSKKYEESKNILKDLCEKNKNDIGSHISLSLIYSSLGEHDNSYNLLQQAFKLNPNHNILQLTHSINLLKKGNFKAGWELYNKSLQINNNYYSKIPFWKGENLNKKKIIVYEDQGVGDSIQFSKLLFYLIRKCSDVRVEVRDSAHSLFKKNILNLKVFKKGSNLNSDCDYKISFVSLNTFFHQNKNNKEEIFFKIDEGTISKWKNETKSDNLKVGLTWSGNIYGVNQPYRSIELKKLDKILSLNCEFICLQNDIWKSDENYLNNSKIKNLGDNNFLDIAAIIKNLDLVITVDTSILHLSASLDKLTWGLFSFEQEWRWWAYNKPPFYKNLIEYKQIHFNNWDNVLNDVYLDLKKLI